MALAVLTERDFVGEGVGQNCGCETAQDDRHWDYRLLVWRRVVRKTRHEIPTDRNWKRTRQGAMAVCIASSAGVRGVRVRSARCKATLNTDIAYWTALCSVTRNRYVVALTVGRWLFLTYLQWKYDTLPVVQTVLHLIHPIYFQFYPFHHFQFSEMSPA